MSNRATTKKHSIKKHWDYLSAVCVEPGDRFGYSYNRFEVTHTMREGDFVFLTALRLADGEPETFALLTSTLLVDVVRDVPQGGAS